jgi:hypothetical protein
MRLLIILIALHASFAFMSIKTNVSCKTSNLNTSTGNPYLPKKAASSGSASHARKCTIATVSLFMNKSENENDNDAKFIPNRPIDLPSLNPQDAGPMYATCRSVTGVEKEYEAESDADDDIYNGGVEMEVEIEEKEEFVPNKPIELESLKRPTFLGLEPKEDSLREKDGSSTETGLPVFTSTVITLMSFYFVYLALFGEDVLVNPSMPLAF